MERDGKREREEENHEITKLTEKIEGTTECSSTRFFFFPSTCSPNL